MAEAQNVKLIPALGTAKQGPLLAGGAFEAGAADRDIEID